MEALTVRLEYDIGWLLFINVEFFEKYICLL